MDFFIFGIHIHIEKVMFVLIVVFVFMSLAVTGFVLSRNDAQIVINKTDAGSTSSDGEVKNAVESDDSTKTDIERIKVYVVGCVKNPGIIEIKKGQIISDAIKAAGGPTNDADIFNINMVYKLTENVMLRINKKGAGKTVPESANSSGNGEAGKGVVITNETGNALINDSDGDSKKGGLININTATASELDVLPGVGEKTAADIIAYREKSGGFKKIEEIMNVSRIGQKRFDSIRALIKV
ncbi:MAG: helix-hairpin-helix domain-containing protein [Clostridia bacterium]